ncbi:MAG: hypothetical protein R2729_31610 [Bryobacteraceae bacterium]
MYQIRSRGRRSRPPFLVGSGAFGSARGNRPDLLTLQSYWSLSDADDKAFEQGTIILPKNILGIAKTVLVETARVLRASMVSERSRSPARSGNCSGCLPWKWRTLPGIAAALALVPEGLEFADAVHLMSRPDGVAFVSFDRTFVKCAGQAGVPDGRCAD